MAYKMRILNEIDRAHFGDVGAILRREGPYSSNVGWWRRQSDAGTLRGSMPAGSESSSAPANPHKNDLVRLEWEIAYLRDQLTRAEAVIEFRKIRSIAEEFDRLDRFRRAQVMTAIEQAALGRAAGPAGAPALSSARAEQDRVPSGSGPAARQALRRCRPGPGLRHAARQRAIPVLDAPRVPPSGRQRWGP
ncbi:hypothetical protein JL100_022480 [Skermanella mucosa]|uniref:hypothetical protein n=1 Tax=Skermanella mucosa TaxID=1789672 RepID=UPI001E4AEFC5|nr:hypothetical protein [Skermanella mucosa]UEM19824.1 hypothetical protein JL100_022480 [Skermanella mucosa]